MCLVWYCERYSERKEEMLPSCTRCQHRFSAIFFRCVQWAHCTVCESLPWPHCPVNKQWLLISETDIFRNKWNWIKVLCKPDSSVHLHFSIALMHRAIFGPTFAAVSILSFKMCFSLVSFVVCHSIPRNKFLAVIALFKQVDLPISHLQWLAASTLHAQD